MKKNYQKPDIYPITDHKMHVSYVISKKTYDTFKKHNFNANQFLEDLGNALADEKIPDMLQKEKYSHLSRIAEINAIMDLKKHGSITWK